MARPNWEYIRVDVRMASNPKVLALTPAARWHLIELWCYCGENLTDGFVPDKIWRTIGRARERHQITGNGFAYKTDGGYVMHDYLDHQRSRADVIALSDVRRKSGSRGGHATAGARGSQTEARRKPDGSQSATTTRARRRPQHEPEHGGVDNPDAQVIDPATVERVQQVLQQTPSKSRSKNAAEAEAEAELTPGAGVVTTSVEGTNSPPRIAESEFELCPECKAVLDPDGTCFACRIPARSSK